MSLQPIHDLVARYLASFHARIVGAITGEKAYRESKVLDVHRLTEGELRLFADFSAANRGRN